MQAPLADSDQMLSAIERFEDARVLCIGDVMLDRFMYGQVERISPEAPIPVFRFDHEDTMLGGAGNVVRNLLSLGANVKFVSVIGDDQVGHQITKEISEYTKLEPYLISERGRQSTQKLRYIAGQQQLLRADHEQVSALEERTHEQLLSIAESLIEEVDAIILSDYGKGVITPATAQAILAMAAKHGKPSFVDPKSRHFADYKGAYLLSPNAEEFKRAAELADLKDETKNQSAADVIRSESDLKHLLVTRGKDGMSLFGEDTAHHIPTNAREVYDVSGAGDTVIATLTLAHISGLDILPAAQLANVAAGVVVGKVGTATIYRTDLKTALYTQEMREGSRKILARESLIEKVRQWQDRGLKVGFTNGCFDVMHAGHVQLLEDAKAQCDRLVVGLNSDDSVKRLKGESRPVNQEMDRAMLLSAIGAVDALSIFREDTPEELLKSLRPDVLMKGADYSKDQVVGGDFVESYGGKVFLLPLKDGYSTTNTIEKLQKNA